MELEQLGANNVELSSTLTKCDGMLMMKMMKGETKHEAARSKSRANGNKNNNVSNTNETNVELTTTLFSTNLNQIVRIHHETGTHLCSYLDMHRELRSCDFQSHPEQSLRRVFESAKGTVACAVLLYR
jgi:hypothetical protein